MDVNVSTVITNQDLLVNLVQINVPPVIMMIPV